MELWDAYNSDFEVIDGITLVRDEEKSIPDGVYHLVCHILVKHQDGTYLLKISGVRRKTFSKARALWFHGCFYGI